MFTNLPIRTPKPDGGRFVRTIRGQEHPSRPPLFEYIADSERIVRPVVTALLGRRWVAAGADRASQAAYLDNFIAFWVHLGYDVIKFERGFPWRMTSVAAPDTATDGATERGWADEHGGSIRSWADFERYPWPTIEQLDFFPFEYISQHVPVGMGLFLSHSGGPYEVLSRLFSYEGLALALHDDPALVKAVAERVGGLMEQMYVHLLQLPNVLGLFPGDDMGFRTATLVAPKSLRAYTLPWHKRFAQMAHERGLAYCLHSCGNLATIMEDLIEDVKIDAKHSYEDVIIPVEDFQARYGQRIGVIGGLDVDRLAAGTPAQVRARARQLIEICGGRGRYVLGSGNSIPNYIPVENYLAMVDEAWN
jgi:uroporphyrinogen decarboxylase